MREINYTPRHDPNPFGVRETHFRGFYKIMNTWILEILYWNTWNFVCYTWSYARCFILEFSLDRSKQIIWKRFWVIICSRSVQIHILTILSRFLDLCLGRIGQQWTLSRKPFILSAQGYPVWTLYKTLRLGLNRFKFVSDSERLLIHLVSSF